MKDTAIEFRQVSKKFKGAGKPAVSDVSLTIREGEFITILGSSGCGKTTLLKMVNRLYEPDSGEILLFGKPIAKENPMELRRKIGYVIQQVGLFPHMTVAENVSIVPKMLKWEPGKIKERVEALLTMAGLDPEQYGKRYPRQLSGGQQQRVAIARAVVTNPKLILADEPTGNLDSKNGAEVMNLLTELNKEGTTIIMVTHSQHDASFAHRTVHLFDGSVVASVTA